MPTCIICLDDLKNPCALPCGHVFCHQCIVRTVRTTVPYTNTHHCLACKQPYTISHVDEEMVPYHLRPFVSPCIRELHLEYSTPAASTKPVSPSTECERYRAENATLKASCFMWRKRASVHATATLGLVGLARIARDYGMKMKEERDQLEAKLAALKRRFSDEHDTEPPMSPSSPKVERRAHDPVQPVAGSGLRTPRTPPLDPVVEPGSPVKRRRHSDIHPISPVSFRLPSPVSSGSSDSDYSQCQTRKRRRTASVSSDDDDEPRRKRSLSAPNSASPISVTLPLPAATEAAVARYLEGTLKV